MNLIDCYSNAFSVNNEGAPLVLPIEENEITREVRNIEDIIPFTPNSRSRLIGNPISEGACNDPSCSEQQRRECQRLVRSMERPVTISDTSDTYQFVRHVILVLFLCLPQLMVSLEKLLFTSIIFHHFRVYL